MVTLTINMPLEWLRLIDDALETMELAGMHGECSYKALKKAVRDSGYYQRDAQTKVETNCMTNICDNFNQDYMYPTIDGGIWKHCRPLQDPLIYQFRPHTPGAFSPFDDGLDPEAEVVVVLRNGAICAGRYDDFNWNIDCEKPQLEIIGWLPQKAKHSRKVLAVTKQEVAQDCVDSVDPHIMFRDLNSWLKSGEYLPEFLRDFHDQKDLFKTMHALYRDIESAQEMPNWVQGHQYVIDWFLWYMASRGYTLQKSRKNVQFREFQTWRD